MKRVLFVWIVCSIASLGSFGVLLLEDRRLGLPLPYSLPLAFVVMLAVVPMLQLLAATVWPQPKIVIRPMPEPVSPAAVAVDTPPQRPEPVRTPAAATHRPGRAAQGVVLFDMSRVPRQAA